MKIQGLKDGPLLITEDDLSQVIEDGEISILKDGPIALCRCGQSAKKPFCDGTHAKCGFKADEIVLQDYRKEI